MAQTVKRLSTMWETQVQPLGREDPLEKEMAIHSGTIAWKISTDMCLSKLREMVRDREVWCALVHRVSKSLTCLSD